jgi:tetratricopeptide (TPR) repeat protein
MLLKDTPQGRELLTSRLSTVELDKKMATIYEKHLGINLSSKTREYVLSFEDVCRDFIENMGYEKWEVVRDFFANKNRISIARIVERLQRRKDLQNLEYYLIIASGLSKDGTEAFCNAEINYKHDMSVILKKVGDRWYIDNVIFGEINLIYSETDSIKHIAYALSKEEYDRAEQLLTTAEDIYYLSPDILYYWGLYFSLKSENKKALKAFSEATDLDINFTEAIYNQAFIHHSENRLDEAIRLYERVLSIAPGYLNALNNLGTIYLYEKQFDKAKGCFQECLKVNPDFKYAVENLQRVIECENNGG